MSRRAPGALSPVIPRALVPAAQAMIRDYRRPNPVTKADEDERPLYAAQDTQIRHVDVSRFPGVTVTGLAPAGVAPSLLENGRRVGYLARRDLGSGPEASVGEAADQTRLAGWVSLAAVVPLSFVLWRRNL